jgi:methyltransferase family protein
MTTSTSLDGLLSDDIAPLFWPPRLTQSAWGGHVAFGHWLIHAARPTTLVELGTHTGVSYFAFCEAVKRTGLEARCFAVDTWKGDKHAGFYPEDIFERFREIHDGNFKNFSKILRITFDEAAGLFDSGEIDIIHIDGLHTYDAVRHDFETWLPKLSERAIALFHDTNERREDFGVWRLWSELRQQYPSFEFLHSHGLGVLCVGRNPPAEVLALCSLDSAEQIATIRDRFESTSANWSLAEKLVHLEKTQNFEIAVRDAKILEQLHENEKYADRLRVRTEQIAALENKLVQLEKTQNSEIAVRDAKISEQLNENEKYADQLRAQTVQIAELEDKFRQALGEIVKIHNSRSWRITAPLRLLATRARRLG